MRGFVPTPPDVVDLMISRLFERRRPSRDSRILDPGCGYGEFIDGVIRWCQRQDAPIPRIVGVELDPERSRAAQKRFVATESVGILTADFLRFESEPFDFVVGNPPYVPITELDEAEKSEYRALFKTARGRFDLYFLFWERGLNLLKPHGRLVFITPEKFLTVASARPLRQLLAAHSLPEIIFLPENTFAPLTTYPTVSVVDRGTARDKTIFRLRGGKTREGKFASDGRSLASTLYGNGELTAGGVPLDSLCDRISCGVATGADGIFVGRSGDLFGGLEANAYPTISGRQLAAQPVGTIRTTDSMQVPYDRRGELLNFTDLNGLGTFLSQHRDHLERRTCARRKPWYAFHETPPMQHLLRPKLLCQDLTDEPRFWKDAGGDVIPRHSVYYLVPRDPYVLDALAAYLNGEEAKSWLEAHCQRAANGYLRLQSSILKKLPIPPDLATTEQQSRPPS